MDLLTANIHIIEIFKIVLVIGVLVIIILYMRAFGGYKISKPFAWQEAVNKKKISSELLDIEKKYEDKVRFYNFWFQIERLRRRGIKGAFAELGVYKGETARAIHYMDPDRIFFLFDTFEGFNEKDLNQESPESKNDTRYSTRMFADTGIDQVKAYIHGNENLRFRPGIFPESVKGLEQEKFALVNIDADLYAPTIEALKFFYPRLMEGGVIIVHDYNHNWNGVDKALNEFISGIPESLVEIPDWQGSVMIVKNS